MATCCRRISTSREVSLRLRRKARIATRKEMMMWSANPSFYTPSRSFAGRQSREASRVRPSSTLFRKMRTSLASPGTAIREHHRFQGAACKGMAVSFAGITLYVMPAPGALISACSAAIWSFGLAARPLLLRQYQGFGERITPTPVEHQPRVTRRVVIAVAVPCLTSIR
jgi:hypothetical protein